jgi:hypothetical protein
MRNTIFLSLAAVLAGATFAPAAHAQRYYDHRDGGYYEDGGIECRSRDKRYNECWTGYQGRPELVAQLSKTACIEGTTWGFRRGYVWVDRGCQGVFADVRGGGPGYGGGRPGYGGGYEITCESRDYRRTFCAVDVGRGGVQLIDQRSDSPCVEGRSWGWDRRGIWVDRGCEGRFAVDGR